MSTGATLIAKTLKQLGVTTVFGIVGIPIVEVGDALIKEGVKFITFRNEQAASYAASAYGYLTGKPGVLLVVGGPGVVHALAGVFNSTTNRWPLLLLAGSSPLDEVSKGAFQELDQVSFIAPHSKLALKPLQFNQLVDFVSKGYRTSVTGKAGVTYIDLPGDIVEASIDSYREQQLLSNVHPIEPHHILKSRPEQSQIDKAVAAIRSAQSPLVIVGKGAAYANASSEIRDLVHSHKFAFLPTPMGKGVVPDENDLNVSSARSKVLAEADVIILLGARLNWILHFGDSPRFKNGVKFIQVDNHAEEIGFNHAVALDLGLLGDISLVTAELNAALGSYIAPQISQSTITKIEQNNANLARKETTPQEQLNYNITYRHIRDFIAPFNDNVILISEGANTMDVARISFPQSQPRQRLDAGTNATMGIGLGYAIASKAAYPDKYILAIEGDSAFGFSGLELETAVRSSLPIIVVVMNNSGVYHGTNDQIRAAGVLPSTALSKDTRYDLLSEALGGKGYLVRDEKELDRALNEAFVGAKNGESSVINVIISKGAEKKIGFGWQNKKASKL